MSVGNAVGAVVGAVIGFYIGGPAGALKGAQLGMTVGGIVDPPKGPSINGPRLTDLTLQSSSYNSVIPRVYGTVALTGNIIWLENNRLKEVETKSKSGGKGGGGGSEVTTYSYYATFAVALCKGPITAVRRIWIGPNLVYDAGSYDMATMIASNETASLFTLHTGTNTQAPDDRMQATLGVANTPAYRGLAYLVFKDLPLRDYGNTLQGSQVKVEVVGLGSVSYNVSTVGAMPIVGTWTDIAWNGSVFCVIGYNTNIAMTSPDGVTWTQHTVPLSLMWNVLIWAEKFFLTIATSSNKCLISKDGITWTVGGDLPFIAYWSGAVWNGKQICAVGFDKTAVSVNGLSWTGGYISPGEAVDVAWNGRVYLLVRNNYVQNAISFDGLTWENYYMPGGSLYWYNLTSYNGWFYSIAYSSNLCAKSQDGINWISGTMPIRSEWRQIDHDGENFYAIARGGDVFAKSSDGLNWTTWPMNSGASGYWCDVVFNGGVYVAITENASTINAVIRPMTLNQTLPNLGQIVSSECIKTGLLSAGDIDVSLLTQEIRGYRIGRITSLKTALEPLQAAYPFDIIQSGYKIKFKPRGSTSIATIPASHLGSTQGE